jgi:hypothetical protein
MNILLAISISFWVFALANSIKNSNPVIPAIFCLMLFAMLGIAVIDLRWPDKLFRWFK